MEYVEVNSKTGFNVSEVSWYAGSSAHIYIYKAEKLSVHLSI